MARADEWIDKLAIQETINRYSDAANRADWDTLEACYAPGAVWEVTEPHGIRFEEPPAIRAGIMSYIEQVETFLQTVHNTVITLHGDGPALARSTLQEIVRSKGKFAVLYWGISYDELVEYDGMWRFSHRRFRGVYVDTSEMGGDCTLLRTALD
jgi:ketosteroid isomerase-like protein